MLAQAAGADAVAGGDAVLVEFEGKPITESSAQERDEHGKLPLHRAAENNAPLDVIRALLVANKDAAKEKDKRTQLPLHRAAENNASLDVIRALIEANKGAAKKKDINGKIPLQRALEKKATASPDVILELLVADMPFDEKGRRAASHANSWFFIIDQTKLTDQTKQHCLDALALLLANPLTTADKSQESLTHKIGGRKYGRIIQQLVEVEDEEERTALHRAAKGARDIIYAHLLFCGRYELQVGPPEHRSATSVVLRAIDRGKQADYAAIFDKADANNDKNLDSEEIEKVAKELGLAPSLLREEHNGSLTKDEFMSICKRLLRSSSAVALKFMQDEAQWKREKSLRSSNDLDPLYVVQALPTEADDVIAQAVVAKAGTLRQITKEHLKDVKLGKRVIVMDAADRNLNQIFLQERPDMNTVRVLLQQIFEAVRDLHDKKLMHGDLKMPNIVRSRVDYRLRLIDLDAGAKIGQDEPSYAGAKFSSAALPPEMFYELKDEEERKMHKKYWPRKSAADEELWKKVAPMKSKSGRSFVVRSFRTGGGDEPINHPSLPYELVKASQDIDVWSLGAIAFCLTANESLVPSTRDDDCETVDAMQFLSEWGTDQEKVLEKLSKIKDRHARDLIDQCLQPVPKDRPNLAKLLSHPFFYPELLASPESATATTGTAALASPDNAAATIGAAAVEAMMDMMREMNVRTAKMDDKLDQQTELLKTIEKRTTRIEGLQRATSNQIAQSTRALRDCIQAAADDTVPTAFVFVPLQSGLDLSVSGAIKSARKEFAALKGDILDVSDAASGAVTAGKSSVNERASRLLECGKGAMKIYKKGAGLVSKASNAINDPQKFAEDMVARWGAEKLLLCLVCELCWTPQVKDGYEVTQQSEQCRKVLPIAKATLSKVKLLNKGAGVVSCFFPLLPIPSIPKDVLKRANEIIGGLDAESSVAEFDRVQSVLKKEEGEREQGKQEGYCLRQFKQLLDEKDPNHKWADLQRMLIAEGRSVWVCKGCLETVKDHKDATYDELRDLCVPLEVRNCNVEEGADTHVKAEAAGEASTSTAAPVHPAESADVAESPPLPPPSRPSAQHDAHNPAVEVVGMREQFERLEAQMKEQLNEQHKELMQQQQQRLDELTTGIWLAAAQQAGLSRGS